MDEIFNDAFTTPNGTKLKDYSSWSAVLSSDSEDLTTEIDNNRVKVIDNGSRLGYVEITNIDHFAKRKLTYTSFRASGNGQRYINFLVFGASNISSYSNFQNSGANIYWYRSDSRANNSTMIMRDGTTTVVSKSLSFQIIDTDITFSLTIESDGSGRLDVSQGVNSDSVTWSSRTWVNGGGDYFGCIMAFSGTDGTGQLTRSGFDDFILEGTDTAGGGFTKPNFKGFSRI